LHRERALCLAAGLSQRAARLAAVRAAIAILVLALTPVASARAGEQAAVIDGIEVRATTSWPSTLNRGWQPARIRLENTTDNDRRVDLTFTCSSGPSTDTVTRSLRVPAGGTEHFELALPVRPALSNSYFLIVGVDDRAYLNGIGAEQACPDSERIVIVASRAGPSTVDTAGWATKLSAESEPRVVLDNSAQTGVFVGRAIAVGPGGRRPAPAGTTPTPEHVRVGGIDFEQLSALPEAYTSLHALALDVGEGALPGRAALDAITAWTRAGGVLAVGGRAAASVLAKDAALGPWIEPRFLVRGSGTVDTYVCGLGLLLVSKGAQILGDEAQIGALNAAIEARAPFGRAAPHSTFDIPIPGIEVPFRSLTLILVLFAILVGPVNLIVVRRSKRPALLLITIPAIAFVFSIGLVVYGVVAQGLDVRATSASVGVLDQRSHHGSAHERRQVFAGLASGPGLRPGPGAVVERPSADAIDWSKRSEYRTETGSTVTLSGAWLPVRTPTRFYVTVDRAARARIDVEQTLDGWKVTNGLESTVQRLVFRDAAGTLHLFPSAIAPGRSAFADPTGPDSNATRGLQDAHVLASDLEDGSFLPRGAWIARVFASPLLDACGLEYEERASDHVVMGILDRPEER
jgi:hypothetical protein